MWPFHLIWPKKTPPRALPPVTPAEVILEVESIPTAEPELHTFLRDAIIEADRQRQEDLRNLLDDKKLRGYFQTTIKAIAEKAVKDNGTCFLGSYTCNVPEGCWFTFMEVFCKTCREMGLAMSHDGQHIRMEVGPVKKFFEQTSPSPVDVDERVRAMLRQGPYR